MPGNRLEVRRLPLRELVEDLIFSLNFSLLAPEKRSHKSDDTPQKKYWAFDEILEKQSDRVPTSTR